MTGIDKARVISALRHKVKIQVKNSISTFFEKEIKFLVSHGVGRTREDLSINVSITTVGLILIQHFSRNQNSISTFFEKNLIIGF